jgi:hypothetical protein
VYRSSSSGYEEDTVTQVPRDGPLLPLVLFCPLLPHPVLGSPHPGHMGGASPTVVSCLTLAAGFLGPVPGNLSYSVPFSNRTTGEVWGPHLMMRDEARLQLGLDLPAPPKKKPHRK